MLLAGVFCAYCLCRRAGRGRGAARAARARKGGGGKGKGKGKGGGGGGKKDSKGKRKAKRGGPGDLPDGWEEHSDDDGERCVATPQPRTMHMTMQRAGCSPATPMTLTKDARHAHATPSRTCRYYFHAETQRTTWTHPARLSKNTSLVDVELAPGKHATSFDDMVSAESAGVSSSTALPAGWEAVEDDEGNTYYYHEKENRTTWTRPEPTGKKYGGSV